MAARYGRIYEGALKDRRLGRGELKVLGALALNAFRDLSNIRGKLAKYLADSGLSRSAWFRAVVRLEKFGYVHREKDGRSVIYKIDPENNPADGTDKNPTDGTIQAAIDHADGTAGVAAAGLINPADGTLPPYKDCLIDFPKDEEEEPSSSVGYADAFDEPTNRTAYLAYRSEHPMPDGFDASVLDVHTRAIGGGPFDWLTIGGAFLDMRGAGAKKFTTNILRGFCRRLAHASRGPAPGGCSAETDLSGSKSEHCRYCVATVGEIGGQRRLVPIHEADCPQANGRRAAS